MRNRAGCRLAELVLKEDFLYSGRRHDGPEPLQLAHDALISPPRVLTC